jgi:hypothetical protein
MMDMKGRWYTENKTLVQVHLNPGASPGNREERWLGHVVPVGNATTPQSMLCVDTFAKFCWNENGECVWIQGIVDDTKKYDLVERLSGRDKSEMGIKVVGCKECENML